MSARFSLTCLSLALALTLASSGGAAAEEGDEAIARGHFATGTSYFNASHYEQAVHEFLEAYRLSPRPALLYNIGASYLHLDDPGRATVYYLRYLAALPEAAERVEIESELFRMSRRVAKLIVHSAARELSIDGSLVEDRAAPQLLTEGKHVVEARSPERLPGTIEVELRGGVSSEVSIEPRGAPLALLAPSPVLVVAPTPAPPTVAATHASRRWLLAVLGVAAAVAIAAIAVGVALATSTDYAAGERTSCAGAGCTLIDLGGGH